MKFFTLLFSFYMLVLAVMPCSDIEDFHTSVSKSSISPSKHSDDESKTDHCSPFCICACCGQSISNIFYSTYYNSFTPIETLMEYPIHNTSFISEVFSPIWQPPKIS